MSELGIAPDGKEWNVTVEPEPVIFHYDPNGEELPRVDAARGVFITSRGEEIQLADKPISSLIVERLQQEGKPKIPMIEVNLMGKHKQLEPHVGHEGYQARLKEWEAESQIALMRYLFSVGVKGTPPQEFVDEQSQYFPGATDSEMKYLWVASMLPDDDLGAFSEAVMGRTLPTTKGIEQAADSFRGEG
jgi:hypothetical protein